jgi:hypothetical protein
MRAVDQHPGSSRWQTLLDGQLRERMKSLQFLAVRDTAAGRAAALSGGRINQNLLTYCAPALASSRSRSTASRLNDAGFWRGGNFLNASIWPATTACIP